MQIWSPGKIQYRLYKPWVDLFHKNDIPDYKLKLIKGSHFHVGKYTVPLPKEKEDKHKFDKVFRNIRQERLEQNWRNNRFLIIPQIKVDKTKSKRLRRKRQSSGGISQQLKKMHPCRMESDSRLTSEIAYTPHIFGPQEQFNIRANT